MNLGSPNPDTSAPGFLGIGGKDGTYYRLDPTTGATVWTTNVVFGGSAGGFIGTTAYDGHRVYGATASRKPFVKDAFHRYIVNREDCVNPAKTGTKAALHYRYVVPAKGSVVLRLRLAPPACTFANSSRASLIKYIR